MTVYFREIELEDRRYTHVWDKHDGYYIDVVEFGPTEATTRVRQVLQSNIEQGKRYMNRLARRATKDTLLFPYPKLEDRTNV